MNFSKEDFLQSGSSWSLLMRKSEEKRWIKNLRYYLEKKINFGQNSSVKRTFLAIPKWNKKKKFEVYKFFFCQALCYMWWHLLRTLISRIPVHDSVKPVFYAMDCLEIQRTIYTLIPVNKNYKIPEWVQKMNSKFHIKGYLYTVC